MKRRTINNEKWQSESCRASCVTISFKRDAHGKACIMVSAFWLEKTHGVRGITEAHWMKEIKEEGKAHMSGRGIRLKFLTFLSVSDCIDTTIHSVTTCDPFHLHHLPGGTTCPTLHFPLPISDLGVRRLESAQARHTCNEENNFEAWTATS